MKRSVVLLLASLFCAAAARADFVILRDGRSYSGTYTGARTGNLTFTDSKGIQYTFPVNLVQSLVFSNVSDHIALRNGQSYTGHLTGVTRISFRGSNGVGYEFPLNDVSSVLITNDTQQAANSKQVGTLTPSGATTNVSPAQQSTYVAPAPATASAGAQVLNSTAQGIPSVIIPSGTQLVIRTGTAVDTATDQIGKLYPATISQNVVDSTGAVGIPAGTQAELQVVDLNQGANSKNPDLALTLHSVTLNGTAYQVDTSSVVEKGPSAGYGMNKRTAEYTGGTAALGTILGAVFGGGKGAGLGLLAGAGAGGITQYLTRGKRVNLPPESTLTFQIEHTLVLHP